MPCALWRRGGGQEGLPVGRKGGWIQCEEGRRKKLLPLSLPLYVCLCLWCNSAFQDCLCLYMPAWAHLKSKTNKEHYLPQIFGFWEVEAGRQAGSCMQPERREGLLPPKDINGRRAKGWQALHSSQTSFHDLFKTFIVSFHESELDIFIYFIYFPPHHTPHIQALFPPFAPFGVRKGQQHAHTPSNMAVSMARGRGITNNHACHLLLTDFPGWADRLWTFWRWGRPPRQHPWAGKHYCVLDPWPIVSSFPFRPTLPACLPT